MPDEMTDTAKDVERPKRDKYLVETERGTRDLYTGASINYRLALEAYADAKDAEIAALQVKLGEAQAKVADFESLVAYLQDRINETGRNANPFFPDVVVDESGKDVGSWKRAIYAIQDVTRETYVRRAERSEARVGKLKEALTDADATLCECRYSVTPKTDCNCDHCATHRILRAGIKLTEVPS